MFDVKERPLRKDARVLRSRLGLGELCYLRGKRHG